MPSALGCWLSSRSPTAIEVDRARPLRRRRPARGGARGDGAEQRRAGGARGRRRGGRGRVRRRVREPARSGGAARRGTGVARNAGRSCWRRCATRGRWRPRRAPPARAPLRRDRLDELPERRRAACGWLRKPLRGGGGRGVRAWAGGRLAPTEILQRRIDGLSCSAVAIGDGRRAAVLGLTEQLHRPPGFGWMGNVTPPRLPDGGARRARRSAARGVRRGRGAVRGARSVRRRRRLGRPPRVGARGQPATAGLARAVRPRMLRGARTRGARHGPPDRRHAPGDAVCEGEARAVRRPRRPRSRSRLVAGGARARHPARRRDDQARRARCARWFRRPPSVPELAERGARLLSTLPDAVLVRG